MFKQGFRTINGVKMDVCHAFYNGKEAYSALQITEMALAAMNAGVYATALWTVTDIPNPDGLASRLNKWGLTRWDGEDYSARDWLYAYGLLVKYLKYNGKPFTIKTDDFLLRSGGVMNDDGSFSVAIVNRHKEETEIEVVLDNFKADKKIRMYLYDSANVPRSEFAELQEPSALLCGCEGKVTITVPGSSIVMLTTDYTDAKPAAVTGVKVEDGKITWDKSEDASHVYYRVFKGETEDFAISKENQIASTIAEYCSDRENVAGNYYKVVSVNRSGNMSE